MVKPNSSSPSSRLSQSLVSCKLTLETILKGDELTGSSAFWVFALIVVQAPVVKCLARSTGRTPVPCKKATSNHQYCDNTKHRPAITVSKVSAASSSQLLLLLVEPSLLV